MAIKSTSYSIRYQLHSFQKWSLPYDAAIQSLSPVEQGNKIYIKTRPKIERTAKETNEISNKNWKGNS